MKFDDVPAASTLMEAIHVLSDEMELREEVLHFCQREVRRVGFRIRNQFAPPIIPFPNQARIAPESTRSRKVFRTVLRPESGLCISERRHATFC